MKKQEHIAKYFQFVKTQQVKKKTVFYHAYRTKIMAGNPYAIFRQLINDSNFDDYEHYWLYSSEDQLVNDTFQTYSQRQNVHYVKDGTDEHMEALATCEYLIDNAALPNYWIKRKGQVYINTWHGTPLKSLGMTAKDSKYSAISNAQRNFLMCDYMVMPNKYTIEKMLESYDCRNCPERTILDAGYPRIDLVLNADKEHIRGLLEERAGTSLKDKKVVLYAPTFRSENGKSMNTTTEMFQKIDEIMKDLPEDYVMFFKVHNTLGSFFAKKNGDIKRYLIFDEIETNELLSVVDVLITDYSSIFFDYLCTKKPILFFAYDREEYEGQHGMYLNMDSLPGPICYSSKDVIDNIYKIREGKYQPVNQRENLELFAYNDDGNASKRVVDVIFGGEKSLNYTYQDDTEANKKNKQLLISMEDNIQPSYLLLLKRILDKLDTKNLEISIATLDKDVMIPFREQYYPEIQILMSPVVLQEEDEPNDAKYLERQAEKYFYGKNFDYYYNLKPREKDIDYIVSAFKNIQRQWFLNEDDYTIKTVRQKNYEYEKIEIIKAQEESKLKKCKTYSVKERKEVISEDSHRMTVVVLAGFDSMNYPMMPCVMELKKRGCDVLVLTKDIHDKVNNKIFIENNIMLYSIFDVDNALLCYTDIILTTPTRNAAYASILRKAVRNNVFIASFSTLFSSIVMKSYPDIVFTLGENKHIEFRDNYLSYNCVATGNPQYDQLLPYRRKGDEEIRRVLIVDQGGYPYGPKGKKQLADTLVRIAKSHPEMNFDIKPRYLPGDTSTKTHNVSEHLYDYIENKPDNLYLMTEATILEDIVVNYDAMITTWSTAYLDALVLNIPVILIEGLDSIDVFDVRRQRVEEAYDKLKLTGCVYNYKDLGRGSDKFNLINKEYANREVYDVQKSSSDRVVSTLMLIYENILKKGMSIDDSFICTADEFTDIIKKLNTINPDENFIAKRAIRYFTNDYIQKYVYTNRCMGYILDLSSIVSLIKEMCEHKTGNYKEYFEEIIIQMNKTFDKILDDTFKRKDILEQIKTDAVLQSYYLKWLIDNKDYKTFKAFSDHVLVPQCYYYYLAIHYINWNKFAAYKYLFMFLDIVKDNTVCQTLLDRRLGITPFRKGLVNKAFFYGTIVFRKKYYLLSLFGDEKLNKNSILCMLRMRYNNKEGLYNDNLRLYKNFESIYSKSLRIRSKRSIKGKCRMWIKKKCFKEIEKQYKISKRKVK